MKTLMKFAMLGFLTIAGAFDLQDYATTYRATRDAYLKAANELKLATGPYKAARDAYVAATATYTKSLYERRHLRAEPLATSAMLEAASSDHKDFVLKSVDAKHLHILQEAYWKADSSESKFHTAQSIEQFLTTQLE